MTDYIITQNDRTLTGSAIKLVKYENKVSRIVFDLDGTIPEYLRLYCAIYNPLTKKYVYVPILYDKDFRPYFIIGTEITYYPSKRWELLLIGISPDIDIPEASELDDSLIVWSSFPFRKLLVLDTFLNEDAVLITHPQIEKAMDDLVILHEEVVNYSIQTGEDVTRCEEILSSCENILNQLQETYNSLMSTMQSTFNQYMAELEEERNNGG